MPMRISATGGCGELQNRIDIGCYEGANSGIVILLR